MSSYKLTDEALEDLEEIFNYFSGYSLDAADRFLDALEKKVGKPSQVSSNGQKL